MAEQLSRLWRLPHPEILVLVHDAEFGQRGYIYDLQ